MAAPLRSALRAPDVEPFVAPSGRFIFTPLAGNVSDGVARVENVNGRLRASLTEQSRARGYKTLEDVCDSAIKAEDLRVRLKWSYKTPRSKIEDSFIPEKVRAMRLAAKGGEGGGVTFPGDPEPTKPAAATKGKG